MTKSKNKYEPPTQGIVHACFSGRWRIVARFNPDTLLYRDETWQEIARDFLLAILPMLTAESYQPKDRFFYSRIC